MLGSRKMPRRSFVLRRRRSLKGISCCAKSVILGSLLGGGEIFFRGSLRWRANEAASILRSGGQKARTLEPPFTWSPTFTRRSESRGSQRSAREPKRTRPMRSPRATRSPSFFQQTTRRAMSPAICLKVISPESVVRVMMFCSLLVEADSRMAAEELAGPVEHFIDGATGRSGSHGRSRWPEKWRCACRRGRRFLRQ